MRAAYTAVSEHHDIRPGFEGMVAEMRWGLANLDAGTRERADDAVLRAIFVHRVGVAALRAAYRCSPRVMARLMARCSPAALGWLVGRVEVADASNTVIRCSFRETGGEALCEHVCRVPTETFCHQHAVPVQLRPHRDSHRCTWTWGAQ